MRRLALLLTLAVATWYYFPETRAIMLDVTRPVTSPLLRRGALEEMTLMGRHVVDFERLTGRLPSGAAWLAWLDGRYAEDEQRMDPWGSVYQLAVWDDSVGIVSAGADRLLSTEDDFRVVTPRE